MTTTAPQTQFAQTPTARLITLRSDYESLRVDAICLPPDPGRPPLADIDNILAALRTELRRREDAIAPRAVLR